jgi:hypothetical protein
MKFLGKINTFENRTIQTKMEPINKKIFGIVENQSLKFGLTSLVNAVVYDF